MSFDSRRAGVSRKPVLAHGRRTAAALALALGVAAAPQIARADGDAAHGQKVVGQCQLCHTLAAGKNSIGPSLVGVVGRKAGTVPGFKYSEAVSKAGEAGLVWDEKTLDRWLQDPKSVVPGNKMPFAGLKNEEDREDAIAFLKTKTQ